DREAGRRREEPDRRGLPPLRAGGPEDRRREDDDPAPRPGRRLLRRAPRAAVLQRPRDLHDLRPGDDPGPRGRERDSEEPRSDGRDRSEEGGAGHDPGRLRDVDRGERRARLGRPRDRANRDRVLLRRGGDLSATALTAVPRAAGGVPNLLGMPLAALAEFFVSLGEKPYRARQLMRWLYRQRVLDFDAMTDISAALRRRLALTASLDLPPVLAREHSADGTRKWLLDVGAGQAVETVFIPEPNRGTLCISSQAGCAMDCAFCATGAQGFNR